jgi:hypothetical protein
MTAGGHVSLHHRLRFHLERGWQEVRRGCLARCRQSHYRFYTAGLARTYLTCGRIHSVTSEYNACGTSEAIGTGRAWLSCHRINSGRLLLLSAFSCSASGEHGGAVVNRGIPVPPLIFPPVAGAQHAGLDRRSLPAHNQTCICVKSGTPEARHSNGSYRFRYKSALQMLVT